MSNPLFERVHGKAEKAKEEPVPKQIKDVVSKVEKTGPRKWKFTLVRDDNGRLSEIIAEAE